MSRAAAKRRAAKDRRGRSYHLVDLENLCGTGLPDQDQAGVAMARYCRAATVGDDDQIVIGLNRSAMAMLAHSLPETVRLVSGGAGPDAAERALIGAVDLALLARRYQRVVVGSGDRAFGPLVKALADAGVQVVVVGRAGRVGRELRETASRTILL